MTNFICAIAGFERFARVGTHCSRRLLGDSQREFDEALGSFVERPRGFGGDGERVELPRDLGEVLAERDVDLGKVLAHVSNRRTA